MCSCNTYKINHVINQHKDLNKFQEQTTQDSLAHPPSPPKCSTKNIRSLNQTPTLRSLKELFNKLSVIAEIKTIVKRNLKLGNNDGRTTH